MPRTAPQVWLAAGVLLSLGGLGCAPDAILPDPTSGTGEIPNVGPSRAEILSALEKAGCTIQIAGPTSESIFLAPSGEPFPVPVRCDAGGGIPSAYAAAWSSHRSGPSDPISFRALRGMGPRYGGMVPAYRRELAIGWDMVPATRGHFVRLPKRFDTRLEARGCSF